MPGKDSQNIQNIRKLVGAVTKEQLRHVDCFVGDNISLFRSGQSDVVLEIARGI